ncbi:hypothetical protein MOO44_03475 [Nicoliella spurrieriana]|uniref:Uncharacterized protein n=2 Tax=Nicoliella spurrieriana TaxID=2925830 RepID=A0A976RSW7_9LACO|nr:hypothetical protein MOO44_03475 [Nicoliella spurrieriana]
MIDTIESAVESVKADGQYNISELKIIPETPYWAMVGLVNDGDCEIQFQVHNDHQVRVLIPLQLEDWGVFDIKDYPELSTVENYFEKLPNHRIDGSNFKIYYYRPYHCLTTTVDLNDVSLPAVIEKMTSTYDDIAKS